MVEKITKGIKVSVEARYEGSFLKDHMLHYAFVYKINIENQSKDSVQVLSRHWKVIESTNRPQYVNGDGIVGKKPVVRPGEIHHYQSGCLLTSPIGNMSGTYVMINFSTSRKFNVKIPGFKLNVPYILN